MTRPIHGGDVYAAARAAGCRPDEILDFSSSINPFPPPAAILDAIREGVARLDRYPDPRKLLFREAVGARFGVPPDCVLPGNGAVELIALLPRAAAAVRGAREALIVAPTFTEYARACRIAGCQVRHLFLDPEEGFRPDPDRIVRAARGADLVFLCNPNNPTGAAISREEVSRLREALPAGILLLVDEAFADFCPEVSVIREAGTRDDLVVIRSLTKIYGLAGLRSGFLVGPDRLVEAVEELQDPWSVNSLAQAAATAALAETAFAEETRRRIDVERAFLETALRGIEGWEPFPSAANFILVRLGAASPDGRTIADAALSRRYCSPLARRILLRPCDDFPGLGPRYLRLAVRTREENLALVRLLNSFRRAETLREVPLSW